MSEILDCIIIGAGPAGLTAALYAARARLAIKIFEGHYVGGQVMLTETISNYPGFAQGISPSDLINAMTEQIALLGIRIDTRKVEEIEEIKDEQGNRIFKIHCQDGQFFSRTLIIATGARPKELNIAGEAQFTGKGVSYCATCDGPMFRGKTVVVIGGGNAALSEAIFLSRFVKKLYLLHRRDRLRATSILQEQLKQIEACEFVLNSIPLAIRGKGCVSGLEIKNVKDNKSSIIDCDGVFIFVGFNPNTDLVRPFLELDDKNFIIADKRMCASAEGVFACGDCVNKDLRQVVTACSDGAQAAYSATNYLIKY